MKVKVCYTEYREIEVEINDKFKPLADPKHVCSEEECAEAIAEVERVTGMPFGDEDYTNPKYIVQVSDVETDETMLEW